VEIGVRGEDRAGWSSARNVRTTPRELVDLPEVRWVYRASRVLGVLTLLSLPHLLPVSRLSLVGVILIFAIVGISLVVLMGWAGQISLGQMAFVGVGAAVGGALTQRLGVDMLLALIGAGVVGAVVAILIGLPALRIRGLFLAITTLAFALATADFFLNRDFFGWWLPSGLVERPPLLGIVDVSSEVAYYHLVVAGFLCAIVVAGGIRHSRTGRLLIATRDNQAAAQAFGVNLVRAKLTAFAISGFMAAFAGGLYVHHQQALQVTAFGPGQSLLLFTMVVVGGLGSVAGAILGAIFIRGVDWFLPGAAGFLAGGVGLLLVLWAIPGGLGSGLYALRDRYLRWVARRRRIVVPSLIADADEFEATMRRLEPDASTGADPHDNSESPGPDELDPVGATGRPSGA
jgi:branched-chain amino acid transport system permease protein